MKILFFIFVLLGGSFLFSSCSDDDDGNDMTFANTPEKDAAGAYQGVFYRVQNGLSDTVSAPGAMHITADSVYVADIGFQCTDFKIDKLTPANISHADGGYVFSNISLANPFGSAVVGRIDESGNVKASFQLKQREGRRTVQYNYTFIGKR